MDDMDSLLSYMLGRRLVSQLLESGIIDLPSYTCWELEKEFVVCIREVDLKQNPGCLLQSVREMTTNPVYSNF